MLYMQDWEWTLGHARESLIMEPDLEGNVEQGVISIWDGTPGKASL